MLSYDDFIKKLTEPPFSYDLLPKNTYIRVGIGWFSSGSSVAVYHGWSKAPGTPVLALKWCLGGTAGSCWGDKSSVCAESEPAWTHLEDILEHFYPNITHLQFRKLERLAKVEKCEDNDYYGGETWHAVKILTLEDLYEFLAEKVFDKEE